MKLCPKCNEPNADSVDACDNCGAFFPRTTTATRPGKAGKTVFSKADLTIRGDDLAKTLPMMGDTGMRTAPIIGADIVFVLDCTGSMGSEIATIQRVLGQFADEVARQGVPTRVGLIGFRDLFEDEPMDVFELSSNIKDFQASLARLQAAGGGDEPESALDALMYALQQPFVKENQKVLVLITDAPPHIPDRHTRSIGEVKAQMERVGITQVYLVIPVENKACNVYTELLHSRQWEGLAFDLGEGSDFEARMHHFKKTLMSLGKTIGTTTLMAGDKTRPMS